MQPHSTGRSRMLGTYFRLKGVLWMVVGCILWWAAWGAPELSGVDEARIFAVFLLVFAVPAVLLWVLGALVKYRSSFGWWLGMTYLAFTLFSKIALGLVRVPAILWQEASHIVPPEHLLGLQAIGALSAAIFAMDVAALVILISPRGRDTWGIGRPNPEARV